MQDRIRIEKACAHCKGTGKVMVWKYVRHPEGTIPVGAQKILRRQWYDYLKSRDFFNGLDSYKLRDRFPTWWMRKYLHNRYDFRNPECRRLGKRGLKSPLIFQHYALMLASVSIAESNGFTGKMRIQ